MRRGNQVVEPLRDRVEADPEALGAIRSVLAPVETDLWEQADRAAATGTERAIEEYTASAWAPVEAALRRLES